MSKDVFICHASEDKVSIVRPLAKCLNDQGISCWIDEAEISPGESITEKVNEGLKLSNFVVVIFSRSFMIKEWPKRELWAVLNIEAKSGNVVIIPIFVGTETEANEIVNDFPLLNDKLYLFWKGDANAIAKEIKNTILKNKPKQKDKGILMLECELCKTPFEYGVRVCLGCQGTIIYGLTDQEKIETRKKAFAILAVLLFLTMFHLPSYIGSWIGVKIEMMWGVGFWAFIIAAIMATIGSILIESRYSAKKVGLVRVFRKI